MAEQPEAGHPDVDGAGAAHTNGHTNGAEAAAVGAAAVGAAAGGSAAVGAAAGGSAAGQPDRTTMPVGVEQAARLPFTVVGIGASAGGLEALTEFFDAQRSDTDMAFVVIQHLPPTRESLMVDILSKHTAMPVRQAEDGMRVERNHVYVIRPGHTLTIRFGLLHMGQPLEKRGHNRPVDDFFRSLAEEQRERAVCVVMSGMGSNGTAGAQMVKAVGGVCVAQDPDSAKFPSMPRSLIDSGFSDFILKPGEMPDVLARYAASPYAKGGKPVDVVGRKDLKVLAEVLAVLKTRIRHDFAGYRKATIVRRIQRRMGLNHVTLLADYAKLIRQTPAEATALADDLMIHVTGFFRDPEAWEALRAEVVAPLVASREDDAVIRCWVSACSSGEEAYTLGMVLLEEADRAGKSFDIKIFATDMAERSLAHARTGSYPNGIESEITPERLARFFEKEDGKYRVRRHLREVVVFAPQNLLQDPPFSRMDICTCRNLLIYLEADAQRRVLQLLHFGLVTGGTLFLGTSETIGAVEDLFEVVDKRARIFRRVGPTRHGTLTFPASPVVPGAARAVGPAGVPAVDARTGRQSVTLLTQRLLLDRYTPPAVVVDRELRIVYFHGRTEPYLDQPRGEPTRDVLQLAREPVRSAIRTALFAATERAEDGAVRDGTIVAEDGSVKRVVVHATPLQPRVETNLFLVTFEELPERPAATSGVDAQVADAALRSELERARADLQSTVEALQATNEEMKASNEEVTSINEELQSTNEELETSKEELQSLNEELTTVNAQLQAKMEELLGTTNDLASLLSSTDIAVIFLDPQFRVRRYTPATRDLVDLIAGDVGRPLKDLARKFNDPTLMEDARAVLDKLVPVEREVGSESGKWYVRRALPYRTADNHISGVVLTFVDITDRRRADEALRASEQRLRRVIDVNTVGIIFVDVNGPIEEANDEFLRMTGYDRDDLRAGRLRWDTITPAHWVDRAREAFDELRASGRVRPYEKQFRRKDGILCWGLFAGADLGDGKAVEFVVDVSERHRAENQLQLSAERIRLAVEVTQMGFWEMNPQTKVDTFDPTHNRIMGLPVDRRAGSMAEVVERIHPDDRARVVAAMDAALGGGGDITIQFRVVWPDGSVHHVAKYGRLIDSPGEAGGRRLIGTVVDVTARVTAELARERQLALEQAGRAEAEAASEAKDQFLANVSHELRTPLSAILLWAKQLRTATASDQQRAEGLDAIARSAEAQRELIEDLLDTGRIVSGKLRLVVRPFDLASLVREAVDGVRPAAEARRVALQVNLAPNLDHVSADPDRLRQVLWNLLSNAVKFTPADGRVDVDAQRLGDDVELTVSDTGRGIAAPALPHVFERFWQAESAARTNKGLGLGLPIAKQLVELHGGTIDAASGGPGKGTTFRVRLPLPAMDPAARPAARRSAAKGVQRLDDARLLLVEDDDATRDALAVVLRGAGADVTAVGTVADALAAFRSDRPDIILSDIGLPDGDGNDLIRQIRTDESDRKAAATPAVALTAMVRRQDRRRSAESGFQQHLAKPVDPDQLVRTLLGLLER